MIQFNAYELISLLSAIIIFILGICLMVVSVPKEPELKNYRISRWFLAIAYIILTVLHLLGIFFDSQIHGERIITSIEAMLLTFSLITLVNHQFVTLRKLLYQLLFISILTSLIILNTYILPNHYQLLTLICTGGYFCLYIYYVYIFFKEYRDYKRRTDNFYSDNENKRLQWVMQTFIMAAIIGMLGGVNKENNLYFLMFIICYTIVYTYLAIRYINYVHIFHRVAPVVVPFDKEEKKNEGKDKDTTDNHICTSIGQWIEEKGFIMEGISLETLALELSTNQFYLSRHINSVYGQNFRSWISSLRITEAQKLLIDRDDLSISDISEAVGISSSSSFYRHFSTITGMTPQEYRNQFEKQSIID